MKFLLCFLSSAIALLASNIFSQMAVLTAGTQTLLEEGQDTMQSVTMSKVNCHKSGLKITPLHKLHLVKACVPLQCKL
jgi:hypothetical protein